jgi:hypothetical protein
VCVPLTSLGVAIKKAFRKRDFASLDELALQAYGINDLPDFEFVDTRTHRKKT